MPFTVAPACNLSFMIVPLAIAFLFSRVVAAYEPITSGIASVDYDNDGKECWNAGCFKGGNCNFCGRYGACCRKGYAGAGCLTNMGCAKNHCCMRSAMPVARSRNDCLFYKGYDYPGQDLQRSFAANDTAKCQRSCFSKGKTCGGFVFNEMTKKCYLKKDGNLWSNKNAKKVGDHVTFARCSIAGFGPDRTCEWAFGVDFYGGDLRKIFVKNIYDCPNACRNHEYCAGFTMGSSVSGQFPCYLKRYLPQGRLTGKFALSGICTMEQELAGTYVTGGKLPGGISE